jgi:hypothetical protein
MSMADKNGRLTPIVTTKYGEFFALRPNSYRESSFPATIGTHTRIAIDPQGAFAMAFIEKWGMVAALPDGEDSSGRAKLRLATVDETVGRACDMAEKAYAEFERRGWFTLLPSMAELTDAVKDKENGND